MDDKEIEAARDKIRDNIRERVRRGETIADPHAEFAHLPTPSAAKFTDDAGREWVLRLDFSLAREIRKRLGIDLVDLKGQGAALTRMAEDVGLLADTLWLFVAPQAAQRGLTDEDFGRGLAAGETFDRAAAALTEALALFSRPPDRGAIRLMQPILTGARLELMKQAGNDYVTSTSGASPPSIRPSQESATSAP